MISETKSKIAGVTSAVVVFYDQEESYLAKPLTASAVKKRKRKKKDPTNGAPSLYLSLHSITETDGCLRLMSATAEVERALNASCAAISQP